MPTRPAPGPLGSTPQPPTLVRNLPCVLRHGWRGVGSESCVHAVGMAPGELALREMGVGEWGKPASPSTWGHPEPLRRWGPSGLWPGAWPHRQESELGRRASEVGPAWGGPGPHGVGCLPLASQASGACAEAWGLPHTVRVWTQTQARASRISATKSHMGVRAHEGRCRFPPQGPVLVLVAFYRPHDTQVCS